MAENRSNIPMLLLAAAAVILLTAVVYFPSLANGFTAWDDNSHLYENPLIRSLSLRNIFNIFHSNVYRSYMPLTTLSFAVEYHFFGLTPWIYHLTNLILHLGVTVLILLFAYRITGSLWSAAAGALIFGIHPMHVESVAWVTERKDVLYGVFYMGSVLTYCRYCDTGKKYYYLSSLALGFFSIISKAMALSLPLILCACDWLLKRKFNKKLLLEKIPYFLYILPIAGITYFLNARVPAIQPDGALIWLWTLTFYIQKFFFPYEFMPYYVLPESVTLANGAYAFALLTFFAILTIAVWKRRNRLVIFALLYYFVSIFFLLRFDNKVDTTLVSDRFMYLPSLGFCILIGVILERLWVSVKTRRILRKTVFLGIILIFFSLSFKTINQVQIWKDGITLWEENIRRYPQSYYPYYFRAFAEQERGDYKAAISDYTQAIKLEPNQAFAYNDRGMTYFKSGKLDLALADLNNAVKFHPKGYQGYVNRGSVYFAMNDLPRALADYKRALALNPRSVITLTKTGRLYDAKRDWASAQKYYKAALEVDPYAQEANVALAENYLALGQNDKAIATYSSILQMDSSDLEALVGRGNCYLSQGRYPDAISDYIRALAKDSSRFEIYSNRGLAYLYSQDLDKALDDFTRTIALNPRAVPALENRAIIYVQKQNYIDAITDLNAAIILDPKKPGIYFSRGMTFFKAGRFSKALADFKKVLEMDAAFPGAREMKKQTEDRLSIRLPIVPTGGLIKK